jgi:hypothetical protein
VIETTTTTQTSTTITDVHDTEIITYGVDDHGTQTSFERESHKEPLPEPPVVSHLTVDFSHFDKHFLRASSNSEAATELATSVVSNPKFGLLLTEFKETLSHLTDDVPVGIQEPQQALQDLLNEITAIIKRDNTTLKGHPTSMSFRKSPFASGHLDGTPALLPLVGLFIDDGIADLEDWASAVVFIDIRAEPDVVAELPQRPSATNGKRKRRASKPLSSQSAKRQKSATPIPPSMSMPISAANAEEAIEPSVALAPASIPAQSSSNPRPIQVADDSRMSRFALEAMNALGNRRHVIGILITGSNLQYYYFDRAGSIRTSPIPIFANTEQFVASLIRLTMLTPAQMGLQPYDSARAPAKAKFSRVLFCEAEIEGVRYRISDVIGTDRSLYGSGVVYYSATNLGAALREESRPSKDDKPVDFSYDRDNEDHKEKMENHRKELEAEQRAKEERRAAIPHRVTLKLSWPLVSSTSDDRLFELASKRGIDRVPRLFGSRVAGRLSDGPRDALVSREFYQDRVLQVQVLGSVVRSLCSIKDGAELRDAFIGSVKGTLYK